MKAMRFIKTATIFSILFSQYLTNLYGQKTDVNAISQGPLAKSNIYWFGEGHATASNYDIAFDFYSKVDSEVRIDYILLESNFLQTHYLNKYIYSGDTNLLDLSFSTSVGTFGWTKEHKAYYERIFAREQQKPKEERIQFVGIDIEHSYWHTHRFLIDSILPTTISDSNRVISRIRQPLRYGRDFLDYYTKLYDDVVQNEAAYLSILGEQLDLVKYIIKNIYNITYCQSLSDAAWNRTRDSLIYQNFKWHNERLHFAQKVSFGLWGTDHIFQAPTKDGTTFIAAHIKNKNPEITQTGYRMLYTNCTFNLPTFFVPPFARWMLGKRNYIRTKALNNDRIWSKVPGMSFLKKRRNKELIYPLNVNSVTTGINLVGNKKKGYQNSDYFQYVILVRKSPACTPLKANF
jgi:hypothetical protein